MNPFRRSPFVITATMLVYAFLYLPIIVLVLYSFNASQTNVVFTGFIPKFADTVYVDGGHVVQSPCGPLHWFCELSKNGDATNAARPLARRSSPRSSGQWPRWRFNATTSN